MIYDEKPSLEQLAHAGVKGMKWGVRKEQPQNSNYTNAQLRADTEVHGGRAAYRINKRMNKGMSRNDALEKERKRNRNQAIIALGAAFVGARLVGAGAMRGAMRGRM